MRSKWRLAIPAALLAFCGSISTALADELHVPRDFVTIQAAIDAAMNGDVVLVAPGTYGEAIDLLAKHIQLRSALGGAGAFATIIDATGLKATAVRCGSVNGPEQVIEGFTITGGDADTDFFGGGGMHIGGGSPTIVNCRFIANRAAGSFPHGFGGGLTAFLAFPTIINCEFIGNHAGVEGGAVAVVEGSITLINCTMVANDASSAGAVAVWDAEAFVHNSIVRDNVPSKFQLGCCVTHAFFSNVQGGPVGDGNIDADPLFVRLPSPGPDELWGTDDDDAGNLRLQAGSPCIDAGDNAAVSGISVDLDGNPRIVDGDDNGTAVVDIGAYEHQPTPAPGDVNGDGAVEVDDLIAVILAWGACADCGDCAADVNDDCTVDVDDLITVILNWG